MTIKESGGVFAIWGKSHILHREPTKALTLQIRAYIISMAHNFPSSFNPVLPRFSFLRCVSTNCLTIISIFFLVYFNLVYVMFSFFERDVEYLALWRILVHYCMLGLAWLWEIDVIACSVVWCQFLGNFLPFNWFLGMKFHIFEVLDSDFPPDHHSAPLSYYFCFCLFILGFHSFSYWYLILRFYRPICCDHVRKAVRFLLFAFENCCFF